MGAGPECFLQATGSVPLAWWIPCMAAAVGIQYLYLWVTRTISLLEAGYVCARAFVLAELAASAEWQLHCFLWPQRNGADGLSLLLLVVVYGGVFGCIWVLEHKHTSPKGHIVISGKAALVVVVMAAMVFAVSNLLFLGDREVDMSVYYIRTLVDICGVLILTVQHEQLRERRSTASLPPWTRCSTASTSSTSGARRHPAHQQPLSRAENSNRGHPRRARPGQAGRGSGSDGERPPAV